MRRGRKFSRYEDAVSLSLDAVRLRAVLAGGVLVGEAAELKQSVVVLVVAGVLFAAVAGFVWYACFTVILRGGGG